MLKWLRRSTRSWFIYLAIGAIVVVFIFWGVGSYKAGPVPGGGRSQRHHHPHDRVQCGNTTTW